MPTVRLTETHIRGLFWGSDKRIYTREDGTEGQCSRCLRWSQTLYRYSTEQVCERHVKVTQRAWIRLTTTFACRVYRDGMTEQPVARVLRRGDTLRVAGRPERVGRFDKFPLPDGSGFVLVPRSRWAWV
jgi:hypothetical protein